MSFLPSPFPEFRVCLPCALLVYNYGSAGCDFCFQFFNLNRFGPNNSKVLFHCCLFPFQNFVCACRALYSSTITDPLGATFASSSSISIVSVQITPKFSFIVAFSLFRISCVPAGRFTRLQLRIRWVRLLLPVLQSQSFRSK